MPPRRGLTSANCPSVFTLTIATGVQDRPADAPQFGEWKSDWKVVGNPSFAEAMSAVASLVLAYGGLPAYFSIVSEMKDPRYYTRSVLFCQGTATIVYIIIGVIVYYFCGSYVGSPALGSAGVLMKKICYGLVLPGLLVTEILYIHVSTRMVASTCNRNDLLTFTVDRKVRLRPRAEELKAPCLQLNGSLDFMAFLHAWRDHHLLLHCQRHPRLRRTGLSDRSSVRYADVLPPNGLHVAVRQLEQQGPQHQMELPSRHQHLHPRWRLLLARRGNVRSGHGHYHRLQHLRRLPSMVLPRQFKLRMRPRKRDVRGLVVLLNRAGCAISGLLSISFTHPSKPTNCSSSPHPPSS